MMIALEGTDQAGKNTQARMLAAALGRCGLPVVVFDFPDYSTPLGRIIRERLKHGGGGGGAGEPRGAAPTSCPKQTLHMLLAANRWEVMPRIRTALASKPVVLMNRWSHSNIVYGMARGMDRGWLCSIESGMPRPDIVVVLDVDVSESFRRKASARDGFEADRKLLEDVRRIYRDEAAARSGPHWKVVDGHGSPDEVHARLMAAAVTPVVDRLCGDGNVQWPAAIDPSIINAAPPNTRQMTV